MIAVSSDYQTAIAKQEQKWEVKAQIDYSDFGIDNSITAGQYSADRLSKPEQMADGIEVPTYKWWSWGNFEWGQHLRTESESNTEQGALSERISYPDKTFPAFGGAISGYACSTFTDKLSASSPFVYYPTFYISFSPRTVSTIKAVFDNKLVEWAEDFDIEVVDSAGVIQHTTNVTNHTSYRYDKDITDVIDSVLIILTVKSWSVAASKAKVIEMFTSFSEQYNGDEIFSMQIHEESLPQNASQPIGNISSNSCVLKILNLENHFDNDNISSPLYNNVGKNKRISLFAKLWLRTTATYEEIPLGVFYSKKWNVNNPKLEATVLGQDIISIMGDRNYEKSQFITNPGDQNVTYTLTADFNSFTLDNVDVGTNEMYLGDEASGTFSLSRYSFSGYTVSASGVNSKSFADWTTYQGTATKQVSFTYTSGETVKLVFANITTIPLGSYLRWYISYKTVTDYVEFVPENGFIYTPEDVTDTTQNFTLKVEFNSDDSGIKPVVEEIDITIMQYSSLYSRASLLIQEFDDETSLINGNYEIDESYGDYEIPTAFLKPDTYQNLLKTITEAAIGRCYTDRNGKLKLVGPDLITTPIKTISNSNAFEITSPSNPDTIANRIKVKVNKLTRDTTASDVATTTITIADGVTKSYTIFFDEEPVDTITYSAPPALVTRDSETEYTWGVYVTFTNSSGSDEEFTFTVSGKVYRNIGRSEIIAEDTQSIRKNGVIEYIIDNPLIQTESHAQAVADLMLLSFKNEKRFLAADIAPDPAIEIGDTISRDGSTNYIIQTQDVEFSERLLTHLVESSR